MSKTMVQRPILTKGHCKIASLLKQLRLIDFGQRNTLHRYYFCFFLFFFCLFSFNMFLLNYIIYSGSLPNATRYITMISIGRKYTFTFSPFNVGTFIEEGRIILFTTIKAACCTCFYCFDRPNI